MWNDIPGGTDVIRWFGGEPDFGDAEVIELRVHRGRGAVLRIATMMSVAGRYQGPPFKHAVFTFHLGDMIDIALEGFGRQNVIGGLTIEPAQAVEVHGSLLGYGLKLPKHQLILDPCAGPLGTIRATVESIEVHEVTDYQEAD